MRPAGTIESLGVDVIDQRHHDRAFTQGLEVAADGTLLESTGLAGHSTVRRVDPTDGRVVQRVDLPAPLYGQGLTRVPGVGVWQLTWQDQIAILRDETSLAERRRVSLPGEGWGICFAATIDRLVMSDGSDRLIYRDPRTFDYLGEVKVTRNGSAVSQINELECAGDDVWGNIWPTDSMVRISVSSGAVTGVVDLTRLTMIERPTDIDAVTNGIAAIPGTDEFWLTGKRYGSLFRVRLRPRPA